MKSDFFIHHRKNNRLTAYDYSNAGSYFITICTGNHEPFFGIVRDDKMLFNDISCIAMGCWESLPEHFPMVSLDEYVFMPNHFHGIINISYNQGLINQAPTCVNNPNPGVMNHAPTGVLMPNPGVINHPPTVNKNEFVGVQFIAPANRTPTLGMVVRSFKALASRQIHLSGKIDFGWQRNYYEHVIRNEDSLNHIREYIRSNPPRWELDRENPDRKGQDEFDKWLNRMDSINIKSRCDKSRPYV
jgi:REP-associated tyrosine transposase